MLLFTSFLFISSFSPPKVLGTHNSFRCHDAIHFVSIFLLKYVIQSTKVEIHANSPFDFHLNAMEEGDGGGEEGEQGGGEKEEVVMEGEEKKEKEKKRKKKTKESKEMKREKREGKSYSFRYPLVLFPESSVENYFWVQKVMTSIPSHPTGSSPSFIPCFSSHPLHLSEANKVLKIVSNKIEIRRAFSAVSSTVIDISKVEDCRYDPDVEKMYLIIKVII